MVNSAVFSEIAVDLGSVVELMALDMLSGRSPLCRLERFASQVDTRLLLGKEVEPSSFNDTTLGRALDSIYEGAKHVLSEKPLAMTLVEAEDLT